MYAYAGNSSVDFSRKYSYIHTFLILTNSSFYKNEPLKGTDCFKKSFDGIFIWPDKVSFKSWALLYLQSLAGKALYFWGSKNTSYWQTRNVHFQ